MRLQPVLYIADAYWTKDHPVLRSKAPDSEVTTCSRSCRCLWCGFHPFSTFWAPGSEITTRSECLGCLMLKSPSRDLEQDPGSEVFICSRKDLSWLCRNA